MKKIMFIMPLCGVFLLPASVYASDDSALEKRMIQLEQKLRDYDEVRRELKELKQILYAKDQNAKTLSTIAPSAGKSDSNEIEISLKPTPKFKSKDGSFEAKIIGFGQADAVWHQDDTVDHPDGTTIRRARVGLAGKIFHDWGYKFLYDFGNNNNPQLQDMFVTYNGFKDVSLIAGQYKEPFGLEWQSPSKYWTFMELPLTTALTPRRSIGAGATAMLSDVRATVGIFGENANKMRSDDEGYSAVGHVAYTPVHEKGKHLHVGGSASYRSPDNQTNAVSYRAKHETSTASLNSVSTGSIGSVDNVLLGGIEALGIRGPLTLQGEYVMADVSRDSGLSDVRFDSHYIQGSWMLTGESRSFNRKKHGFTRVKPSDPFDLQGNGIGAWELAARYENLDLNDNAITGGEMDRYVLGLNWHPNEYLRFMLNYVIIDTDGSATQPDDGTQAVGLRAQVDF